MIKTDCNAPILLYKIDQRDKWGEHTEDNLYADTYTEEMALNIFKKRVERNKENKYYKYLALRVIDKRYHWYTIKEFKF